MNLSRERDGGADGSGGGVCLGGWGGNNLLTVYLESDWNHPSHVRINI